MRYLGLGALAFFVAVSFVACSGLRQADPEPDAALPDGEAPPDGAILEDGAVAPLPDGAKPDTSRPDAADTGSLLGLGFPQATGGLLRWVEHFGLPRFVDTCAEFAREHGARFTPSPWLRERAALGRGLADWRTPTPERTTTP